MHKPLTMCGISFKFGKIFKYFTMRNKLKPLSLVFVNILLHRLSFQNLSVLQLYHKEKNWFYGLSIVLGL